jgi:hypothetical protein
VDDGATTSTTVTFSTTHFSLYEVGDDPVIEGEDSVLIFVMAAVACTVVVAGAGAAVVIRRR